MVQILNTNIGTKTLTQFFYVKHLLQWHVSSFDEISKTMLVWTPYCTSGTWTPSPCCGAARGTSEHSPVWKPSGRGNTWTAFLRCCCAALGDPSSLMPGRMLCHRSCIGKASPQCALSSALLRSPSVWKIFHIRHTWMVSPPCGIVCVCWDQPDLNKFFHNPVKYRGSGPKASQHCREF